MLKIVEKKSQWSICCQLGDDFVRLFNRRKVNRYEKTKKDYRKFGRMASLAALFEKNRFLKKDLLVFKPSLTFIDDV